MTRARIAATLVVVILGASAALTGIWDPDFFHHLAVGRAIAAGTSFAEDPFLFPFAGVPSSLPPYWLGSLLIYFSSLPHALVGPQLLVAILFASIGTILLVDGLDGRGSWRDAAIAAALVILALPELRVRSAPRPEAFGLLFVAYTQLAVRRFERGHPRLLLLFPVLALVWNQVHVSVAIGIGLLGILVAWSLARAAAERASLRWGGGATWREARSPIVVLALSLAATLVTPSQESPLRIAAGYLASLLNLSPGARSAGSPDVAGIVRAVIEELAAPSPIDWTRPFGLLVACAIVLTMLRRAPDWPREAASVLVVGWFASTSFRFAPLAVIVAAPIATRALLGLLDGVAVSRPGLVRPLAAAAAALTLVRATTAPTLRQQPATLALDVPYFPVRAASYLRDLDFDGRLYNAFGAGGYLEWTVGRKVFQDGRGMLTPADARDLFPEPVDRERLLRLDARWRFDALVMSTRPPLTPTPGLAERTAAIWDTAPDPATWSLVAMDEGGSLFLRRDGRWAEAAARDEYRTVKPGVILRDELLSDPAATTRLAAELDRMVREAPACDRCRAMLAGTLLQGGRLDEASAQLTILDRSVDARTRPTVDLLLATRAQLQGDAPAFERHLRDAIRRSANPAPLRRALAMQLLGANRDADAAALVEENLAAARSSADLELASLLAHRAGDPVRAEALQLEAGRTRQREASPAP